MTLVVRELTPAVVFETDVGAPLQWQLFEDGAVMDLSTVTVTSVQLLVNGLGTFSLTVLNAGEGIVQYVTQAGDFPSGVYSANIEVILTSPTRVFTTRTFQITSKPLYGA